MKTGILSFAVAILCMLVSACSADRKSALLSAIPSDASVVIILSDELTGEVLSETHEDASDDMNFLIGMKPVEIGAFELSSVARVVTVGVIQSTSELRDYLTAHGYAAKDENIFSKDGESVLVDDSNNVFYMAQVTDEKMSAFASLPQSASKASFSKSPLGKSLDAGASAAIIAVIPESARAELASKGMPAEALTMFEGAVVANCYSEDSSLKAEMFFVSPAGERRTFGSYLPVKYDTSAKVSKKALEYMGPNINAVFAASLKDVDWAEWNASLSSNAGLDFKQKAVLAMMRPYLEKINGTVAVGLGAALAPGADLTSMAFDPSSLIVTFAVETAKGKAGELLSDLNSLITMIGVASTKTEHGFSSVIPGYNVSINAETHGNLLVVSTLPLTSGGNLSPALSIVDFNNYIAVLAAAIPAESPLQSLFPSTVNPQYMGVSCAVDMAASAIYITFECGREGAWYKNIRNYNK